MFLTTHYLDEADALSDRIVVIDRGRIVAADTADNLKNQVAGDLIDLEITDAAQVPVAAQKLGAIAEPPRHGLPGIEVEGTHVRGRVQRAGRAVPGLLRDLERSAITLEAIEVHRPTLDDVFLTLTGRSLRDAESGPGESGAEDPDRNGGPGAGPAPEEGTTTTSATLAGVRR